MPIDDPVEELRQYFASAPGEKYRPANSDDEAAVPIDDPVEELRQYFASAPGEKYQDGARGLPPNKNSLVGNTARAIPAAIADQALQVPQSFLNVVGSQSGNSIPAEVDTETGKVSPSSRLAPIPAMAFSGAPIGSPQYYSIASQYAVKSYDKERAIMDRVQNYTPDQKSDVTTDGKEEHLRGRPIIANPDGSIETVKSSSIRDDRLNGGKPTVIPTIWDGKEWPTSTPEEIRKLADRAVQSGQVFPAFETDADADKFSRVYSAELGNEFNRRHGREEAPIEHQLTMPANAYSQIRESQKQLLGAADAVGAAREKVKNYFGVDPRFADSLWGQIVTGASQMVGYVGAAAIDPLALAGIVTSTQFQQSYDDYTDTMRRLGKEPDRQSAFGHALAQTAISSPLDMFGVETLLGKVFKKTFDHTAKGIAKAIARRASVGFATEGSTEAAQQFLQDAEAMGYDPDRDVLSLDEAGRVLRAGFVGGVVGSLAGGASASAQGLAGRFEDRKAAAVKAAALLANPNMTDAEEAELRARLASDRRAIERAEEAELRARLASDRRAIERAESTRTQDGLQINAQPLPSVAHPSTDQTTISNDAITPEIALEILRESEASAQQPEGEAPSAQPEDGQPAAGVAPELSRDTVPERNEPAAEAPPVETAVEGVAPAQEAEPLTAPSGMAVPLPIYNTISSALKNGVSGWPIGLFKTSSGVSAYLQSIAKSKNTKLGRWVAENAPDDASVNRLAEAAIDGTLTPAEPTATVTEAAPVKAREEASASLRLFLLNKVASEVSPIEAATPAEPGSAAIEEPSILDQINDESVEDATIRERLDGMSVKSIKSDVASRIGVKKLATVGRDKSRLIDAVIAQRQAALSGKSGDHVRTLAEVAEVFGVTEKRIQDERSKVRDSSLAPLLEEKDGLGYSLSDYAKVLALRNLEPQVESVASIMSTVSKKDTDSIVSSTSFKNLIRGAVSDLLANDGVVSEKYNEILDAIGERLGVSDSFKQGSNARQRVTETLSDHVKNGDWVQQAKAALANRSYRFSSKSVAALQAEDTPLSDDSDIYDAIVDSGSEASEDINSDRILSGLREKAPKEAQDLDRLVAGFLMREGHSEIGISDLLFVALQKSGRFPVLSDEIAKYRDPRSAIDSLAASLIAKAEDAGASVANAPRIRRAGGIDSRTVGAVDVLTGDPIRMGRPLPMSAAEIRQSQAEAGHPVFRSHTDRIVNALGLAFKDMRGSHLDLVASILRRVEEAANELAVEMGEPSRFRAMRVVVTDRVESAQYNFRRNTIYINPRVRAEDLPLHFIHETGHFFAEQVIGRGRLMEEWQGLTPEQRRDAVLQYLDGDPDARIDIADEGSPERLVGIAELSDPDVVSDIEIGFSPVAAHEWMAMQFTRIVRNGEMTREGAFLSPDAVAAGSKRYGLTERVYMAMLDWVNKVYNTISEWIGNESLSSKKLNDITWGLMGYDSASTPRETIAKYGIDGRTYRNEAAKMAVSREMFANAGPLKGEARKEVDRILDARSVVNKPEDTRRVCHSENVAFVADYTARANKLFDLVRKMSEWKSFAKSIPDVNTFMQVFTVGRMDSPENIGAACDEEAANFLWMTRQDAQAQRATASIAALPVEGDSQARAGEQAEAVYRLLESGVSEDINNASAIQKSVRDRIAEQQRIIKETSDTIANSPNPAVVNRAKVERERANRALPQLKNRLVALQDAHAIRCSVVEELHKWWGEAHLFSKGKGAEINALGGLGCLTTSFEPINSRCAPEEMLVHQLGATEEEAGKATQADTIKWKRALWNWLYNPDGSPRLENKTRWPGSYAALEDHYNLQVQQTAERTFTYGRGLYATASALKPFMRTLEEIFKDIGHPSTTRIGARMMFRYNQFVAGKISDAITFGKRLTIAEAAAARRCFGSSGARDTERLQREILDPALIYMEQGGGTSVNRAMIYLHSLNNPVIDKILKDKKAENRIARYLQATLDNSKAMGAGATVSIDDMRASTFGGGKDAPKARPTRGSIARNGAGSAVMKSVEMDNATSLVSCAVGAGFIKEGKVRQGLSVNGIPQRETIYTTPQAPKQGQIDGLAKPVAGQPPTDPDALVDDLFGEKTRTITLQRGSTTAKQSLFDTFLTWFAQDLFSRIWRTQSGEIAMSRDAQLALHAAQDPKVNPSKRASTFFRALYRNATARSGEVMPYEQWLKLQLGELQARLDGLQTVALRSQSFLDGRTPMPGRFLMDARIADDLPVELVEFYHGNEEQNRILLASMAFNTAFGRDGSLMYATLNDASKEADAADLRRVALEEEARSAVGNDPEKVKAYMVKKLGSATEYKRITKESVDDFKKKIRRASEAFTGNWAGQLGDFAKVIPFTNFLGLQIEGTLMGIKSTMSQFSQLAMPTAKGGVSPMCLAQLGKGVKYTATELSNALMQALGIKWRMHRQYTERIALAQGGDPWARLSFWENLKWAAASGGMNAEYRNRSPSGLVYRGVNMARALINSPLSTRSSAGTSPVVSANLFHGVNDLLRKASQKQYLDDYDDMASRANEFLNEHRFDPKVFVQPAAGLPTELVDGFKFTAGNLGYVAPGLPGTDMAFRKLRARMEERIGSSFEEHALDAFLGRLVGTNGSASLFSESDIAALLQISDDDASLLGNSLTTRPAARHGLVRFIFTLKGWSIGMMRKFALEPFVDENGRFTPSSVANGVATLTLMQAPAVIALCWLRNWVNEDWSGKKTALPPIGMGSVSQRAKAILSAASREGMFGLYPDVIATTLQSSSGGSGDLRGAFADTIYWLSQSKQAQQLAGRVIDQKGETTYASCWRPLAQLVGFNGLIQDLDVINDQLELNNAEARYNRRVSVRNIIRTYAPRLGYEVMSSSFGEGKPWTPHVSAMADAAMSGDVNAFNAAKSKAIAAYKKYGDRSKNAAKYITDSFVRRHPLKGMFRTDITTGDFKKIRKALPDNLREDFDGAINSYNDFMRRLGKPAYLGSESSKGPTDEDERKEYESSLYPSGSVFP